MVGLVHALATTSRVYVGSVLLIAAVPKLFQKEFFASAIAGYGLLPKSVIPLFARALPVIELMIGGVVIPGILAPWPEFTAVSLLVVYSGAVMFRLLTGRTKGPCGCAGGKGLRVSWEIVMRNGFLVALGVAASGYPGLVAPSAFVAAILLCMRALAALTQRRVELPAPVGAHGTEWIPGGSPKTPGR